MVLNRCYAAYADLNDCFISTIILNKLVMWGKRLFIYHNVSQVNMAATKGNAKTAAVIGSGFGGLAAAIRLQSAGIDTVLYEARDKPGGRAYVYHDEGYTFDAGPTVVTAPHTLEELFELTDRKLEDYVELMEVGPMYRLIWSDGDRFDYVQCRLQVIQE